MERVLIVAKTHMKNGVCVSALTRNTNRHLRLIPPARLSQSYTTQFEIGQAWDIEFREDREITLPHTEDVTVVKQEYVSQVTDMRAILEKRVQIWRGGPECIFDGLLTFENTSAYIAKSREMPKQSTGYWMPTNELCISYSPQGKPRYNTDYRVRHNGVSRWRTLHIPYVGFAKAITFIPKETLIRVSLARWWKYDGANEDRCYLQLSGWYL